jgi:hypothetical protein
MWHRKAMHKEIIKAMATQFLEFLLKVCLKSIENFVAMA